MQLKTAHFLFAKRNCKPSDCEDGLALDKRSLRFCVTDGASEAFDSRKWARLLAAMWKKSKQGELFDVDQFISKIAELSTKWTKKWSNRELPWYAEEKAKKGSFAAFLGIEIESSEEFLSWRAVAVGDCCLFIQNAECLSSFPLEYPEQFGLNPILIPTKIEDRNLLVDNIKSANGQLKKEDIMLLMSDAMSNWYLSMSQKDPEQIREFLNILKNSDRPALENLIDRERQDERLRNDDVSIIFVSFA